MFCSNCGKEVSDAAVICLGCGSKVKRDAPKWSTTAMVVFTILTVIVPLIGIIYGIYGFTSSERRDQGAVLFVIGIVMTIVYMSLRTY